MITKTDTTAFACDGGVFLSQAFNQSWIDMLREGIGDNISNPGERGRIWGRNEQV